MKPMTIPENNLKRAAERLTLTDDERAALRERVRAFVDHGPVRNAGSVRRIHRQGIVSFIHDHTRMPIFVVLLVLGLGAGGTSFAAQDALPGDLLYPVKIHVNEGVRSAFALTTESQAKLDVDLADERLQEAEELAGKAALNPEKLKELTEKFNEHMSEVRAHGDELKGRDVQAAQELEKALKEMLKEHAKMLSQLAGEHADDDDSALDALKQEIDDHDEDLDDDDAKDESDDEDSQDAKEPEKSHETISTPGLKTEIQREGDRIEINTEKTDDKDEERD